MKCLTLIFCCLFISYGNSQTYFSNIYGSISVSELIVKKATIKGCGGSDCNYHKDKKGIRFPIFISNLILEHEINSRWSVLTNFSISYRYSKAIFNVDSLVKDHPYLLYPTIYTTYSSTDIRIPLLANYNAGFFNVAVGFTNGVYKHQVFKEKNTIRLRKIVYSEFTYFNNLSLFVMKNKLFKNFPIGVNIGIDYGWNQSLYGQIGLNYLIKEKKKEK